MKSLFKVFDCTNGLMCATPATQCLLMYCKDGA